MTQAPYSPLFLEHLRRPPRPGGWPEGEPCVAVGEMSAPDGSRRIRIELKWEPDPASGASEVRIIDARFRALGCSATLVCASLLADAVVGAPATVARRLFSAESLSDRLDLDPERKPAAEMALLALEAAIAAIPGR